MATTNLGRVAIVAQGEYNPSTQYEKLDIVRYAEVSYLVLRAVKGVVPTDGADYSLLAGRGESAYEVAVANGYVGTEQDWLAYIRADGSISALQKFMTNDASTEVSVPDYGNIPSLQGYIATMFENGGLPATPFATKALMTASELVDGDYAMVTDDTVNNGLYVKTEGAWVESSYDPELQANKYTDSTQQNVINEVNTLITTDEGGVNILEVLDSEGSLTLKQDANGDLHIPRVGNLTEAVLSVPTEEIASVLASVTYKESSPFILEIQDATGATTLRQDANGDLHTINTGNITSRFADVDDKLDALDLYNQETALSGGSNSPMGAHWAGRFADNVLMETTEPHQQTGSFLTAAEVQAMGIFDHEANFLRVPTILRVESHKYLLIFEARITLSDLGVISLGVATIDIDPITLELTKSDVKALHKYEVAADGNHRVMNPCTVLLDDGTAMVLYVRRSGWTAHKLYVKKSTDNGVTWGEHEDISYINERGGFNLVCPCSQGFVKRYGKNKGRIIVPAWHSGAAYEGTDFRAGFIYSDDNGLTWELGKFSNFHRSNEVSATEDLNGDIIFKMRIDGYPERFYVLSRYSDLLETYTEIPQNHQLAEDPTMCGLIQGVNRFDLTNGKLILIHCKKKRTGLHIKVSYDGGETWSVYDVSELDAVRIGYTTIDSIDAKHVIGVWESEYHENLSYGIFSLKTLLNR